MVQEDQIAEIVHILATKCRPEKIILFGSYAQGTANEESDLDLAIIAETDLPKFKRPVEFQKALRAEGRRWLFPMDIVVFTPDEVEEWKNNPYTLIHEIFLTGKILYESSEIHAAGFFRSFAANVIGEST
jgi:uncharacterized protein